MPYASRKEKFWANRRIRTKHLLEGVKESGALPSQGAAYYEGTAGYASNSKIWLVDIAFYMS